MRIYHIISGDLWAGAEIMAYHLLKSLQQIKLDISVTLLNHGRLADKLITAGIEVEVIDEQHYSFPGIVRKIRKKLLSHTENPCIIHAHRYKENIITWLASRGMPQYRLVSTQHGLPESYNHKVCRIGRLKTGLNFYLLKQHFTKVVAVSYDIKDYFVTEMNFSPDQIGVIHNGILIPSQFNVVRNSTLFYIGSSGRLFPVKDYPLMIDISRHLQNEKGIRFFLAGEGPDRPLLKAKIDEASLGERFTLEGHLDDMDPFYKKLGLYLNTSVHEGIPLAILEAMAQGLPIVAPRVGGIPEVVEDGVEGFLIAGRSAGDFAEKCLLLARNRELHTRMSLAARKKVEQAFSVERMTEQYLKLYTELFSS